MNSTLFELEAAPLESEVERKHGSAFGSVNAGVKGARNALVWRRATAAGADTWIRGCPDAAIQSHACTHTVEMKPRHQLLDILSITTRKHSH